MKFPLNFSILRGLAIALAISSLASNARANVYATNLKLNGTTNNPTIVAGQDVSIGYILNEPASAGVTITIQSGTNVVRTMFVPAGNSGTSLGTNTVPWNGKNDAGVSVAGGDYSFSVTAAATGYSDWTQISSDTNAGNQVFESEGIAVNQNTNSFYYGRVFVALSHTPEGVPLGFNKFNADASPADEGIFSDGGYTNWTGYPYYQSPFRVKVGADDRFYALDYSGNGVIFSWDQQITTNSILSVMRDDNNPEAHLFSGFFITGTSTNRQVWMADDSPDGYGIKRWDMQPDGTLATDDLGTNVVAVGGDMANSSYDVAVDMDGRIYALCQPSSSDQYKYLRFPPYTDTPLLTADWKVDTTSDIRDPLALAVNPAATYVAAALSQSDAVLILDANTGASVATISTNSYPHYAAAWDNAGNVYTCFDVSDTNSIWQAWSPPGTNQATTFGLEVIHVLQAPQITSIVPSGLNLILNFTGPPNYPPSAFTVLSGSVVTGATNVVAASITGGGGVFQAIVPANGPMQFYRIQMPSTVSWVYITQIRTSGETVTLNFTGPSSDPASAFTVLSGSVPTGITNVTAATITGSGGVFQATVPASGPSQIYRIQR